MLKKLLFSYKSEQGMAVRGTGLALLAAFYLFGCVGLYYTAKGAFGGALAKPIAGLSLPLVDQPLNGAFLAAVATFLALVFVTAGIMNKAKNADLMIETESELQKVTWPSWNETVNASIVVIFTTILMALLLFIFDFVLRHIVDFVLGL